MGLFTKASPDKSLAAATLVMGTGGEFDFSWEGDPSFALRVPGLYLDWALNKGQKRRANQVLETLTAAFGVASREDPQIDPSLLTDGGFRLRDVEVVVGVTDKMRANVSFRPRVAVATHMYIAFAGLWNGLTYQLARDGGDDAVDALLHDMQEQLTIHNEMGVSMRGGVAPMLAGQRGAGARLELDIAETAGLSTQEFRALPDDERELIIDAHTEAALAALRDPHSHSDAGLDNVHDPDLQAVLNRVGEMFADVQREKGAPQYYPGWFVRRLVSVQVLGEAGLSRPEIVRSLDSLFGDRDVLEEDPQLDQGMEQLTQLYQLGDSVTIIVDALSDPGEE